MKKPWRSKIMKDVFGWEVGIGDVVIFGTFWSLYIAVIW